jgi:hypothetical protein
MPFKITSLTLPETSGGPMGRLFKQLAAWAAQVTGALNSLGANPQGPSGNSGSGVTTLSFNAANAQIAISGFAHFVSGSGSLATIQAPQGFTGVCYLIPLTQFTINDFGNIAIQGSFLTTIGQVIVMVYDGKSWYASQS